MNLIYIFLFIIGISKELIILNEKFIVGVAFILFLLYFENTFSSSLVNELNFRINIIKDQNKQVYINQINILQELINSHKIRVYTNKDILAIKQFLVQKLNNLKVEQQLSLTNDFNSNLLTNLNKIYLEEVKLIQLIQQELIISNQNKLLANVKLGLIKDIDNIKKL